MTVNRRKKSNRHRGHSTHGWGSMKKHRGKGHQGGAGMAGTGKRADSKKPSVWNDTEYFGKHGFISKSRTPDMNPINVGYIEMHINNLVSSNKATKEKDSYNVDLAKIGYNKLLGSGRVSMKLNITVDYASKSAIDKVKEAGGQVTVKQ